MLQETKDTLVAFVEVADRLEHSGYIAHMKRKGQPSIVLSVSTQSNTVTGPTFPDDEKIQALALNMRMIVQDNEMVSLHSLTNLLADPGLTQDWKDIFASERDKLNGYLDGRLKYEIDGQTCTPRMIFDTYLYGNLSHFDRRLRPTYLQWKSHPLASVITDFHFHECLQKLTDCAAKIADASRDALK